MHLGCSKKGFFCQMILFRCHDFMEVHVMKLSCRCFVSWDVRWMHCRWRCMKDMLHEDPVLVLTPNNSRWWHWTCSSLKELRVLHEKNMKVWGVNTNNKTLCCLGLNGLHLNMVGSLDEKPGAIFKTLRTNCLDLKIYFRPNYKKGCES